MGSGAAAGFPGGPNIILLHWHDLGTRLGSYGHAGVRSPRLDRLAASGLRFDAAFSTAPLCSPARGSLFTGTYPAQHGLTGLAHKGARYADHVVTLPRLLAPAGYISTLIGLQHESPDADTIGFDEVVQPEGGFRCDSVADLAVDWLSADHGPRPYFLTVGFFETHRPYRADWYGSQPDTTNVVVPPFLPDNDKTRADLAMMERAIEIADTATGRIIDAVDATDDADDTMVVFTTDHGIAFPRAKSTLYDPGIHVALIIRPPRSWQVAPGVVLDLTSHVDVAATLLEVAGASAATDGISFAAALRGTPTSPRTEVHAAKDFHEVFDPIRCVRTDRHKYIRNMVPGPKLLLPKDIENSPTREGLGDTHLSPRPAEELYDLLADPDEQVNVAGDPDRVDLLDEMRRRMDNWLASTGDPVVQQDPGQDRATSLNAGSHVHSMTGEQGP